MRCVECCYSAARVQVEVGRFKESDMDDVCELMLVGRETFLLLPRNGRQMFDAFCMFVRSLNPPKNPPGWKKELLSRLNTIQKDRVFP